MRGNAAKAANTATLSSEIDQDNTTKLVAAVFKHPMPCGIGSF